MRNRTFTLAVPPFSIHRDELQSSENEIKNSRVNSPTSMRISLIMIRRIDHEL
jgi:hypothetical protein